MWFPADIASTWYYQGPPQRGQYTFLETAIQTALILRRLYHLPLRQTEGFVVSVLVLMDLNIAVSHHTTLSRRQAGLAVDIATQPTHTNPIHTTKPNTAIFYSSGGR